MRQGRRPVRYSAGAVGSGTAERGTGWRVAGFRRAGIDPGPLSPTDPPATGTSRGSWSPYSRPGASRPAKACRPGEGEGLEVVQPAPHRGVGVPRSGPVAVAWIGRGAPRPRPCAPEPRPGVPSTFEAGRRVRPATDSPIVYFVRPLPGPPETTHENRPLHHSDCRQAVRGAGASAPDRRRQGSAWHRRVS